jgi:hypothetical protein
MEPKQGEYRFKINGWYLREADNVTLDHPDFPPPPKHWYPLPNDSFMTKTKGDIKPRSKNWHTTIIPLPDTIDYLEYVGVGCEPNKYVWFIDAVKPVPNEKEDPKNNSYKHIHRAFGSDKMVMVEPDPVRVKNCDRILLHYYPFNSKCEFPTQISIGFAKKKTDVSFVE